MLNIYQEVSERMLQLLVKLNLLVMHILEATLLQQSLEHLVSITKVKQRKIFLRSHKEKQLNFIMIVSVFLPKQIFMIVAN